MLPLAYLSRIVRDSVALDGEFHAYPIYILLNLIIPIIVGLLLAGGIKILNFVLTAPGKRNR